MWALLPQWLCTLMGDSPAGRNLRRAAVIGTAAPARLFFPVGISMSKQTFHADHATRQAAKYAQLVQDGVNLRAIATQMLRDIDAMRQAQNLDGDAINNHPVVLAYLSKLNSLTRLTADREMAALTAINRLANGEDVESEVIPL